MKPKLPCADPNQATLSKGAAFAALSLSPLHACSECWGSCRSAGKACDQAEGWRRARLYNAAQIPKHLARMDMAHAVMLTGSPLSSAWRWLQRAADLPSLWVQGDNMKRAPRAVLAALTHELTTARGIPAQYIRLDSLADLLVAHYRSGESQSKTLRRIVSVEVLALDGLGGAMRERDARTLAWVANHRAEGCTIFGATRTSSLIAEDAGRMLEGDAGAALKAWMGAARPMGWA